MRVLLLFTLGFAGAAGLSAYLLTGGWWVVGIPVSCFLLLLGFAFQGMAHRRVFCISLGLILGFLWCGCYRMIYESPAEQMCTGEAMAFSGTVLEAPSQTAYGSSVTLRIQPDDGAAFQALVYLSDSDPGLAVGDTVRATGKFRTSSVVQGEASTLYTSKGIYAIVTSVKELCVTGNMASSLPFLPYRCAAAVQDQLTQLFAGDSLGLAEALLTGDQDRIPDDLYVALQRSGTAHIVAVSGLHVMLLASLLLLIPGTQWTKRMAALPLLWFFALVTGCRPAIIRAALMETLLLLAPAIKRDYDAPTGLSGALLVLLVQNPNAIANVGLQLSFASVAGLLMSSPKINGWILKRLEPVRHQKRLHRGLYAIGSLISASCGAQVLSIPLCAYYFGTVSVAGILTNLLVLPVLGLLFGLLLATVGCAFLCAPLGMLLSLPCKGVMLYISSVCRLIGSWNFSALSMEHPAFLLWLCLVYLLLAAFLLRQKFRRYGPAFALVGVAALLCAIFLHLNGIAGAPVTIQVLNVGQGQCIVAFSGNETIAVDCGGNRGSAGNHLANVLQNANRTHLDALIFTHYDSDHTGGLEALLSRTTVENLYIPDLEDENRQAVVALAEAAGCTIHLVSETQQYPLSAGQVTLYAPLESEAEDNNGLSVLFSSGEDDFFLTGDLSIAMEELLVERESLPDVEYMMAGHHGSKYATGDALLDEVTPETVICSVGYNTYGHPTEEALNRLASHGCAVLRTDQDGTITVRLGANS